MLLIILTSIGFMISSPDLVEGSRLTLLAEWLQHGRHERRVEGVRDVERAVAGAGLLHHLEAVNQPDKSFKVKSSQNLHLSFCFLHQQRDLVEL